MAERKARKRPARKRRSWPAEHSLGLAIGAVAAVLIGLSALLWAFSGAGNREAVWVKWDGRGAEPTRQAVRDTLRARLGPAGGTKVYWLWRLQGGKPAVGAYRIDPGQSAFMAARRLAKGYQTPVPLTFNNVRTVDALAERVAAQLDVTPAEFLAACDTVLTPLGFRRAEWPAAFLPDTYEFYYTVEPSLLVKKLVKVRNAFWTPERTARADAMGLTPAKVATVASIVEEESAKLDERPVIARLYLNRLAKGMRLQADPTVKFASGNFAARRITADMLRTPSPYNTYQRAGLPPGPIRIADRRTLDAVLNAPAHDWLYMCAKEDFSGYHNFATDYDTHRANARRYQAALDRRGIKK